MPFYAIRTLLLSLFLLCAFTTLASAQSSVKLPVQGVIADAEGVPLEGTKKITFTLYLDAQAGESAWQETQDVALESGIFNVFLGQSTQLDAELFASNPNIALTFTIEGDEESARLPFGSVPYASVAQFAQDAATVGGKTAADLAQDATAYDNSQSGLAATKTQAALDELLARITALEASKGALEARLGNVENLNVSGRLDSLEQSRAAIQPRIDSLEQSSMSQATTITTLTQNVNMATSQVTTLSSQVSSLSSQVTPLVSQVSSNTSNVSSLLSRVTSVEGTQTSNSSRLATVEGTQGTLTTDITALQNKTASMTADSQNVYFTNVNLHVRSGSGTTSGAINGRGNLVLGYNEDRVSGNTRTGSHNLILGRGNNYSSYAGIVGGRDNEISATYASIISGANGTASGSQSVIVTGQAGEATNTTSAILTGFENSSTGFRTGVLGGSRNSTTGVYATVGGGSDLINTVGSTMTAEGAVSAP